MDTKKLLKKLKEIKVDAYNNVHSSEEESPLQVYDGVWGRLPVDEDAKGEDVKIERTKGEKVKVPKTLSRTTSMSGAESPSKDIYLTDGGTKKSIQQKLDEFKEFLERVCLRITHFLFRKFFKVEKRENLCTWLFKNKLI